LKKGFLKTDAYHTDKNTTRLLFDRLMLNSRWAFMSRFIGIVLKNRRIALRGTYDTNAWASSSLDVFNLIEKCGGRFHITGLDNIRNCKEPVVFISNHMSTLETMIFPGIIAPIKEVTFVVKESLVKHPVFGPVMRSRNPIIVSRANSRDDFTTVMNKGQELLAQGTSVIIFPQSMRRVEFEPREFNTLGVKLAKMANVQIIPIAIKTDFWENGKYIKELGPINRDKPIYMTFGKPFNVNGPGKEENNKIIEFIMSYLTQWSEVKA